jgi:hypothetical protein
MFNLLQRSRVLNFIGSLAASLLLINQPAKASTFQHVLILSVDGLHSADILDPPMQPYLTNINSLR